MRWKIGTSTYLKMYALQVRTNILAVWHVLSDHVLCHPASSVLQINDLPSIPAGSSGSASLISPMTLCVATQTKLLPVSPAPAAHFMMSLPSCRVE